MFSRQLLETKHYPLWLIRVGKIQGIENEGM